MSEEEGFYAFLGKIDAYDGQYIGGMKGMRKLVERLGIQKTPEFKVLEVGAATGFTSRYVAREYGCSVISTDISDSLVDLGRRKAERLGLGNIECRVADAMDLDFPDEFFDAVYGIATNGVLPDKPKALREYLRVVKPGGMVGGLDLFMRDEASPSVEIAINLTMGKVIGSQAKVMKLNDWRGLLEDSGLVDVEFEAVYEDVLESPEFTLGTFLKYLKLVYYLVTNPWFRSLFFEIMELRKVVSETSGDIFNNMGYLIYTGRKG